jgi:hypothetical protein
LEILMISQQHAGIGSWRIELYPDEQSSVNHALVALLPGGVLIASPPPVEPFPPAEEGAVYVATGLGAWQASGDDEVELGFVAQATDSKGNLLGFGSVHATGRFDDSTGMISGRYHFEEAGPDETVFATEDGMVRGSRISATSPERSRYLPTAVTASGRS